MTKRLCLSVVVLFALLFAGVAPRNSRSWT